MPATLNGYGEVIAELGKYMNSAISVPALSALLRVKATTLNARLRRERVSVRTVGRTHYIPCELALRFAEAHKFALVGWPTLEEASNQIQVKAGTLKARCEKGLLEGHLDLTKRLRINPADLQGLQIRSRRHAPTACDGPAHGRTAGRPLDGGCQRISARPGNGAYHPARLPVEAPEPKAQSVSIKHARKPANRISPTPRSFALPPAPDPEIVILTNRDYGLPDQGSVTRSVKLALSGEKPRKSGCLTYDPEQPFSVSGCVVGKSVRYGDYQGTIVRVIDDPFSPRIQVRFPEHQHPLMREVLLAVAKRFD